MPYTSRLILLFCAPMTPTDLLTRAVEESVPPDIAKSKLESGKKLRVYLGIDPTGAKLHLGHAVVLRKLNAFAEAGHEVTFLIGSYTAMIGDPSGRDAMREPLSKDQVMKNFETYKEQASKVIDFSKVSLRYNHEWLETLSFEEILKISSAFTVQQMLQRDMFQERMKQEKDLNLVEFMYPLMVGYDSVVLDVDCEIGGNDQLFNMLCGRKLQKAYGKRDKFVLTTKLLEGTDGRKMSKTYDNCIWLEDSAKDMYGKLMSIKDDLIVTYFECCTNVPMEEIDTMSKSLDIVLDDPVETVNPKDLKMRLAREVVTIYHGAEAAQTAEKEFQAIFKDKGIPTDIETVTATKGAHLIDVLVEHKTVASKSEARRLIEQGGIKIGTNINERPVESSTHQVGDGLTSEEWANGVIVKVGKRKFLKIAMNS